MNNYTDSTKLSEAIIGASFFLCCIILIGGTVIIAMTAYPKPKAHDKLPEYIVQSGFIEVSPSGK